MSRRLPPPLRTPRSYYLRISPESARTSRLTLVLLRLNRARLGSPASRARNNPSAIILPTPYHRSPVARHGNVLRRRSTPLATMAPYPGCPASGGQYRALRGRISFPFQALPLTSTTAAVKSIRLDDGRRKNGGHG